MACCGYFFCPQLVRWMQVNERYQSKPSLAYLLCCFIASSQASRSARPSTAKEQDSVFINILPWAIIRFMFCTLRLNAMRGAGRCRRKHFSVMRDVRWYAIACVCVFAYCCSVSGWSIPVCGWNQRVCSPHVEVRWICRLSRWIRWRNCSGLRSYDSR